MSQRITQVDAFTDRPFAGNPAAVCVLPGPADEGWMRNVAREMNLSETAFLHPLPDGFRLRWFTPTTEVDLCGHATLASAHVLWEEGFLKPDEPARFHTRSGLLTAALGRSGGVERKEGPERAEATGTSGAGRWITLDFPSEPEEPASAPRGLAKALGAEIRYTGRNRFDYLVELESEAAVRALRPDFTALAALPVRGIVVTARSASSAYDLVSRFFAPNVGVPEDPVTGSAHCCLGPFWGSRLDKTDLVGYQASARGGVVRVRLAGSRVLIGGQAVTVMYAELV